MNTPRITIPEPHLTTRLFADPRLAPLWTALRLYVGYEWVTAALGKLTNPAGVWVGEKAGVAVMGFFKGALAKTNGEHPDVQGWYAWFLENVAMPNATLFSFMVAYGELFVGIALILGLFTGLAAFFGGFLNANFLLAGTVSLNPVLFIAATWLVLGWRVAGYLGLDHFVLPRLGVQVPKLTRKRVVAAAPQ
ncbi:DoxX family membrane protein [Deinococcus yavapaiensis]|uniref:Thiosulfate dehydrogenase [quinone] large subunit n=1 Tax=Deinococcus yavapaiensis KR-236 TaxID=694435 RepID=A0A318S102_9DEIO|nr:DoxX family membrane protein [Deinococcus yavapaiensis]PYE50995.1 thiosulfate dehydrogenase [quinone] large subunit [Deinococcus yavapaiensis KR-236]